MSVKAAGVTISGSAFVHVHAPSRNLEPVSTFIFLGTTIILHL